MRKFSPFSLPSLRPQGREPKIVHWFRRFLGMHSPAIVLKWNQNSRARERGGKTEGGRFHMKFSRMLSFLLVLCLFTGLASAVAEEEKITLRYKRNGI